jgi:RNA polymerase sigma-70 factor (ECF subfamily)
LEAAYSVGGNAKDGGVRDNQRSSPRSGSNTVVSNVAEIVRITDGLRLKDPPDEGPGALLRLVIERAQAGEAAAFDQIVFLSQRKVVSTAWRFLGNQDDALDASQEVFIKLHRYLHTFRSDQDFSAWLYRLIVNACHDIRKRRPRHLSLEEARERGSLDGLRSRDDVEAAAMVSEDERIVVAALATLSEKERAALVLRDLEGLSTEKVSKILGSSPTTVRSQICSARAKIKAFRERVWRDGRRFRP